MVRSLLVIVMWLAVSVAAAQAPAPNVAGEDRAAIKSVIESQLAAFASDDGEAALPSRRRQSAECSARRTSSWRW